MTRRVLLQRSNIQKIVKLLKDGKRHFLIYGADASGKTHSIEQVARIFGAEIERYDVSIDLNELRVLSPSSGLKRIFFLIRLEKKLRNPKVRLLRIATKHFKTLADSKASIKIKEINRAESVILLLHRNPNSIIFIEAGNIREIDPKIKDVCERILYKIPSIPVLENFMASRGIRDPDLVQKIFDNANGNMRLIQKSCEMKTAFGFNLKETTTVDKEVNDILTSEKRDFPIVDKDFFLIQENLMENVERFAKNEEDLHNVIEIISQVDMYLWKTSGKYLAGVYKALKPISNFRRRLKFPLSFTLPKVKNGEIL